MFNPFEIFLFQDFFVKDKVIPGGQTDRHSNAQGSYATGDVLKIML